MRTAPSNPATSNTTRPSLGHDEAIARAALVTPVAYDLELDLTGDDETFETRTVLTFHSRGGRTFVDLAARVVRSIRFNGASIPVDRVECGRLYLDTVPGRNVLSVHAKMAFRGDGEGMHRSVDPADGRVYIYAMCFLDAAPTIFACFDQPDLKAPFSLTVTVPPEWTVVGNAPATVTRPGRWRIGPTKPLATYLFTLVAGPYRVVRDQHDGITLSLSCKQSLAPYLNQDTREIFTLTAQCFDEFHRLFGIRYPFGDYHQAFVPDFNAGAMENPGCVLFREQHLFQGRVARSARTSRAITIAHEMAHQWFGNMITPVWWDDLWLNESFAEYLGTRVAADVTEYHDAWDQVAWARRTWGLSADQRPSTHPVANNPAPSAAAALQNFDGISYAKGSSIVKQIATVIGDDVFFAAPSALIQQRPFGNITMQDLIQGWEAAGADDLTQTVEEWLNKPGPDTFTVDRETRTLHRRAPTKFPAQRQHQLTLSTLSDGSDRTTPITVTGDELALTGIDLEGAVILDRDHQSWGLYVPDNLTVRSLRKELPLLTDPGLRVAVWNNLKSGYSVGVIDPDDIVEIVISAWPVEDTDDLPRHTLAWLRDEVLPLASQDSTARVHHAAAQAMATSIPGSDRQLAAFRACIATADDVDLLERWLARTPPGVEPDDDIRWRILVRLAALGARSVAALDADLATATTAANRVEYVRAVSSLPTRSGKEFAWSRFTGTTPATNYELEAAGRGMWRHGQQTITGAYLEEYAHEVPHSGEKRRGFALTQAIDAFFPTSHISEECLAMTRDLLAEPLETPVRRRLIDQLDLVERRLHLQLTFPKPRES